jgi:hypothetical protein
MSDGHTVKAGARAQDAIEQGECLTSLVVPARLRRLPLGRTHELLAGVDHDVRSFPKGKVLDLERELESDVGVLESREQVRMSDR